jgi:hypothetical protein
MNDILKVTAAPRLTRVKHAAELEEGLESGAGGWLRRAGPSRAGHQRRHTAAAGQGKRPVPAAFLRQRKNVLCGSASVAALRKHR